MATTAAVNVAQYTEMLEPLLQAGKDVLVLAFSSGLSTTYNSSAIAVEMCIRDSNDRRGRGGFHNAGQHGPCADVAVRAHRGPAAQHSPHVDHGAPAHQMCIRDRHSVGWPDCPPLFPAHPPEG